MRRPLCMEESKSILPTNGPAPSFPLSPFPLSPLPLSPFPLSPLPLSPFPLYPPSPSLPSPPSPSLPSPSLHSPSLSLSLFPFPSLSRSNMSHISSIHTHEPLYPPTHTLHRTYWCYVGFLHFSVFQYGTKMVTPSEQDWG